MQFEARRMPTPRPTPLLSTTPEGEAVDGEAFVQLTDQSSEEISTSERLFTGEVTNNGDKTATNVTVSITVTDTQAGGHCLTGEMAVDPSTLEPGEKGKYEDEFNHPCFSGKAAVELVPEWD
jgi:hypothetical protein